MSDMSILDLKAHYHGLKYVKEVFKLLPDFADKLLINRITLQITNLGAINGYRHVAQGCFLAKVLILGRVEIQHIHNLNH